MKAELMIRKHSRNTIEIALLKEGLLTDKKIRITSMIADLPYINVRNNKIRISWRSRSVALMKESGAMVWLRYFKFKDDEVFKEFLKRLGL